MKLLWVKLWLKRKRDWLQRRPLARWIGLLCRQKSGHARQTPPRIVALPNNSSPRGPTFAHGFWKMGLPLVLAEDVITALDESLTTTNPWPDNAVARWSLGQFTARTATNL